MKRNLLSTAALLSVMLSAGEVHAADATAAPDAKAFIEQAETTRKEAASLGYEWRDTASLIKKAQDALAAGQEAEASKFAQDALLEGQQSVAQAHAMQKSWQTLVPKP